MGALALNTQNPMPIFTFVRQWIFAMAIRISTFTTLLWMRYQDTAVYEKYAMSRPSIHALDGGAFGVLVEYEIIIPFELFNTEVAEITVPITIVSQFKQK